MEPNISLVASLIGEPARARMLTALMSGKALTATELALEADITPPTASSHLSKLVDRQLLVVRKQGRHRYFQIQGVAVAELIESLLNVSASLGHSTVVTGPDNPRLRRARICYDHLAGELGVALYNSLTTQAFITESGGGSTLTESGAAFFTSLEMDINQLNKSRRPLCKACLDWSERRSHLAGALGQWVLSDLLDNKWATQDLDSRAIHFTRPGLSKFVKRYRISVDSQI